ncbi:hypothetical protein CYPRO_3050 [Cyclonatronum proteinivorum]|uniref:Uncharacterized protein n=1 Tax=Cyclonatronum proteinivorum TaxID=1457365 RepID=A0A345UP85_9BACT|nr:hypothetical protein CYPRO_3050 [Cyclonatronum proteinivorum]
MVFKSAVDKGRQTYFSEHQSVFRLMLFLWLKL